MATWTKRLRSRITSYNVCYTKLLRRIIFANRFIWFLIAALGFFLFFAIQVVLNGETITEGTVYNLLIFPGILLIFYPTVVITSYSIHYTKLYEGETLNIMAIIGVIMLVGIAVNDSIILVDRINQLMREGVERKEAILLAGQQRIRPIIMTSLTTILALIPLTIGFGESASLRSPMALAVIGGLITSTLLTLIVRNNFV